MRKITPYSHAHTIQETAEKDLELSDYTKITWMLT